MTQELTHHPSGSLALATALAASAGFVDAHVYLNVTPVFVANMSGNLIRLGISAGVGRGGDSLRSLLALAAFFAGVVVATGHHGRAMRRWGALRPGTLLAGEAVMVLSLPLVIVALGLDVDRHPRPAEFLVIGIAAFAMGMQTAALRRVGAVAVATTYGTGAIVRIGEKVGLALGGTDRSTTVRRRITIVVLTAVLVSYVVGAVAAARLGSSPWQLVIPGAVLVVAAIAIGRGDESPAE